MARPITRLALIEMLDTQEVQLVDVLPELEYSESHLPGAINIPLKVLGPGTVSELQPGMPTVVY